MMQRTRNTNPRGHNYNTKPHGSKSDPRSREPYIDPKILDRHSSEVIASVKSGQLSRAQVTKSLMKVYQWKLRHNHNERNPGVKAMPKEYLDNDIDPALFLDSNLQTPIHPLHLQIAEEKVLDGLDFETRILPECVPHIEEKRDVSIREWLKKREEKLQERDHLRKWLRNWQEQQDTSVEELIKMWQKKRREYTYLEWIEIDNMEDNQKLTCNQLLNLYRKDTAPVKLNNRIDTVTTPNPAYENESNISSGVIESTTALLGSTQVSSPRSTHTKQKANDN